LRLEEAGEFGLIGRIREIAGPPPDRVLAGIGDDTAVFRPRSGYDVLFACDALVEHIHFDLSYTPLDALGWKALAVNLSDIAAMGGIPIGAVVSAAIPRTWSVEDVEALFSGLVQCGRFFGCALVGGDTVASGGGCFLSVSVVGEVETDKAVRRSGANAGDLLCVTGEIGGGRTGFEVLTQPGDRSRYPVSVERFLRPRPRLSESRTLVRYFPIASMIDISDGLASEIRHLCLESGLGCRVDEETVPVSEEALRWAKENNRPVLPYAFESGEEYELLFTVPPEEAVDLLPRFKTDTEHCPVTVIGEMRPKSEGACVQWGGSLYPLDTDGWDHFKLNRNG